MRERSRGDGIAARYHRPELDGLRLLAFLAVFAHHGPWSSLRGGSLGPTLEAVVRGLSAAGAFGVDLFFVLSSYLITELLLRASNHSVNFQPSIATLASR